MWNFFSADTHPAAAAVYEVGVALFLAISLAVIYLALRLNDAREAKHDPQIGLKAVLHFSFSVAILIVVIGLTILADDLASADAAFLTRRQRVGAAMAAAGFIFAGLHWLLLRFGSNDAQFPAARRMFAGWRLALHSLVVIAAVTLLLVELVQETRLRTERYRTYFAVLCIWGPSWLIHLVLLWWYSASGQNDRPAVSWEAE